MMARFLKGVMFVRGRCTAQVGVQVEECVRSTEGCQMSASIWSHRGRKVQYGRSLRVGNVHSFDVIELSTSCQEKKKEEKAAFVRDSRVNG